MTEPDMRWRQEDAEHPGYHRLLQLGQLLSLQREPAQHDQLMFIIVHQVHELWFKLILFELEEVRDLLAADHLEPAAHLLRRITVVQNLLVSQWAVLDTMLPADFLAFRDDIMAGSGFESVQYREIEFLAGLKDEGYLKKVSLGDDDHKRLRRRLEEPSVRDALLDAAVRRRIPSLTELYRAGYGSQPHSEWDLLRVAEGMLDFDQALAGWRARHTLSVERQIGYKPGTGGSAGVDYLRSRVTERLFPELWGLRTAL